MTVVPNRRYFASPARFADLSLVSRSKKRRERVTTSCIFVGKGEYLVQVKLCMVVTRKCWITQKMLSALDCV